MTDGRVRIAMGEGIGTWIVEAPPGFGESTPHAHHAVQLTISVNGRVSLFDENQRLSGPLQAVASNHPHGFAAEGLVAFIFVEPESAMGRQLAGRLFDQRGLADVEIAPIADLAGRIESLIEAPHDDNALLFWASDVVSRLTQSSGAPPPDPRVQQILDFVAAHIEGPLDLSTATKDIYFSQSRLRHLFAEQTGLGFKTYVLWRRLMRAVRRYGEGDSLTDAAHAAGFADSAHFSRTFKRTFGLPATSLRRLRP